MVQRKIAKEQYTPSERSFKRDLANSGYSKDLADKIWKCYNMQEINSNTKKTHSASAHC